jgi:murein DD-endopeptidase MepM/ murein hydrolase activator NlpD
MHSRFVVIVLLFCVVFSVRAFAQTQDAETLRNSISKQNELIKQLEAEIAQYQKDLTVVSSQKQNLSTAIKEIDTSRKRAEASIALTKQKINQAESKIRQLETEINTHTIKIGEGTDAVRKAIRFVDQEDNTSLIELMLRNDSISESWEDVDRVLQMEKSIGERVSYLKKERDTIAMLKGSHETQKRELTVQEKEYVSNKQSLDVAKQEKAKLLTQTKNQESQFQKILNAKKAAKKEFEDQLRDYESQLKFVLDTSKLPPVGRGVLSWPLDKIKITQKFGNTAFARSGAYSGQGHNGVDFNAATGTPVKAALNGVVQGTGNTDQYGGCYSYGKWVLIKHPNNLTTLYAHFSSIGVDVGQQVTTGQVIGYSGNTGYSTGPHLHFSVFASDAVNVVKMSTIRPTSPCRNAAIPVSAWNGYLDPLEYL